MWEALLDRALSERENLEAVTALLPVAASEVQVVSDLGIGEVGAGIRLLCERRIQRGEFLCRLSLYLRDRRLRAFHEREFFQGLAGMLQCRCLVSDSSPSPHSMLLLRGPGRTSQVWLDPDRLEQDEYVLIGAGRTSVDQAGR
jgi:hypothetical protein